MNPNLVVSKLKLLPLFVLLLSVGCETSNGVFYISNKSDYLILELTIFANDKKFSFQNIKVNESKTGSHRIKFDGHYSIEATFDSGRKIQKNIGYFSNGFNYTHYIGVTNNNIKLLSFNTS